MPNCALCQQREADKTGSHLVPFFLMRTIDNVDNKKERGMELGFELGKGHVKGYFGGSVLPERLEPQVFRGQRPVIDGDGHRRTTPLQPKWHHRRTPAKSLMQVL